MEYRKIGDCVYPLDLRFDTQVLAFAIVSIMERRMYPFVGEFYLCKLDPDILTHERTSVYVGLYTLSNSRPILTQEFEAKPMSDKKLKDGVVRWRPIGTGSTQSNVPTDVSESHGIGGVIKRMKPRLVDDLVKQFEEMVHRSGIEKTAFPAESHTANKETREPIDQVCVLVRVSFSFSLFSLCV